MFGSVFGVSEIFSSPVTILQGWDLGVFSVHSKIPAY